MPCIWFICTVVGVGTMYGLGGYVLDGGGPLISMDYLLSEVVSPFGWFMGMGSYGYVILEEPIDCRHPIIVS